MATIIRCFAFHAFLFLSSAALINRAAAQHSDIFVTNLGDTKTGIGGADVDGGMFNVDARVFESVLVVDGTPDYSRNEPGFFALSDLAPGSLFPSGASPLEANSLVSISFRTFAVGGNSDDLFYWNGLGAVDFQPAAGVVVSLSDSMEPAGGNGELDFHPHFQIDDPLGTAANGVYLASLTMTAGSLAASDPIFLVFLVDDSIIEENAEEIEEDIEAGLAFQFFEEAVEYVETRVAVPEPASLMAMLAGAVGMMLCGRHLRG
jgi:hypothetical protein